MKTRSRTAAILLPLVAAAAFGCEETPQPVVPPPPTPSATAPVASSAPVQTAPAPPTARADPNLIARRILFGNPDRLGPIISPNGKQIAFAAPSEGVLNVWVAPADDLSKAKVVTHEKARPVRNVTWSENNEYIVFSNDKGGDENFHVFAVELKTGTEKDLTPFEGVRADLQGTTDKHPKDVLIQLNKRDKKFFDPAVVDITTGKMTVLAENTQGYAGYVTDDDEKIRMAVKLNADGTTEAFTPGKKKDEWVSMMKIPEEDQLTTSPLFFDKSGKTLYMMDSRGRDTGALYSMDWASKKSTLLAEDPKADVGEAFARRKDGKMMAVVSNRLRKEWHVLDKSVQPDFDALKAGAQGDFSIISTSTDGKRWTVAYVRDDGPVGYYLYDQEKKKLTFLYNDRKQLDGVNLTHMHPVEIKSRDGLGLVSYLSLPREADVHNDGHPDKPLPMVLLVHGGPWARDQWSLNSTHQWLANRGYAVLSVNFRGSTGFGKKFVNAGDHEWAGKMHDDLIDAVKWAVDGKVADPAKVAIMGGSYGGYSALIGVTFTPDQFACSVDIVGPSNLVTLLDSIPPYWQSQRAIFVRRIGDPSTPEGKKFLFEHSALSRVDAIKKPLLIGQGANDPRVHQAESDQIVKAMQAKNLPVTYVLYPDEGHGFARPENRMSFNAVAEIFLAEHLGGSYQPIGDDLKGSSITVPAGADQIVSLGDVLGKK